MTDTLEGDLLVRVAREVADIAHHGQFDKVGKPYITHPARVASRVERAGHSPEAVAAAWLHDIVEDCPVTFDQLRRMGFPESVVAGVDSVTHRPGESRADFIARAMNDPVGRAVKLEDIRDNANPERMALLTDDTTRARLVRKYARDLAQMGETL